jgi:hypothetical protein
MQIASQSEKLRTRYCAARDAITERNDVVTRKQLAYELGIPYKTVCTYLIDNPQLTSELKVVDTYGRVYARKRARI